MLNNCVSKNIIEIETVNSERFEKLFFDLLTEACRYFITVRGETVAIDHC